MSAPPKMNALTHLADVCQSCRQQRITVGAGTQAGFSNRLIHSLEHIKDPLSRPVHLHIVSTQFCRDACPLTYTENTVRLGGISHQRNLLTKPEDWRWRRAWQWSFNAAKQVLDNVRFQRDRTRARLLVNCHHGGRHSRFDLPRVARIHARLSVHVAMVLTHKIRLPLPVVRCNIAQLRKCARALNAWRL